MGMIIEICANSYESAKAAMEGGASRIELCTNLSVGGLTPSRKLIRKVITELNIAVHVLIRPRGGNFVYSEDEIETMLDVIGFCKKTGCSGIVSGILTSENTIDEKAGFEMIHFSATKKGKEGSNEAGLFENTVIGASDRNEIERIIKLLA